MFERYTEKARRVIFFARYEASQYGLPTIETEHLLLGLLREDKALTNRFLRAHASVESIRKQINEHTVIREKVATAVDLPLSNESKRVLAYAAEEAQRLGHKHIGTEHLLLGVLREEKCFAAQILEERGLKLKQIRDELKREPHQNVAEAGTRRLAFGAGTSPFLHEPAWRLIEAGVKIDRPDTCIIDTDVEVGEDTIIEPFVQLLGKTRVGSGCRIRSFSVIENCTLGNGVLIRQSCVLEDSTIADGAQIGPFAHLRPGSEIGENAHVGNFVETKKAKLGKGAKANHLTYLGDAEIGEGANIGAGTITCNYDGVNKHVTRIGKDAFVGSDSTLVAPVTVGDGAYIGAGSCITKDVPADALAVSRAKQANIEGWAASRRAKRPPKSS
ncbi:MAG: Clp protease N-terminal domain-containing protein [Terracidiphilus sp.]|jgi:bifunctional UDP-N-acetylglucosamine pyrophosphorylase/glucosamine-1-phosphate N-acetyltransferase